MKDSCRYMGSLFFDQQHQANMSALAPHLLADIHRLERRMQLKLVTLLAK
jgi:hypothetical protein